MKATETPLLQFLKKSPQFVIPIYQRAYSWEAQPHCLQLWNDILRAGENNKPSGHFIGSVVYIEAGMYQVSDLSSLLVIDGQQRLTTVALLIEALARAIGDGEIEGFSAPKLRQYYLLNSLEKGDLKYKILLTETDKKTLLALLKQEDLPEDASLRLQENFEFFEQKIQNLNGDLTTLCRGITKLRIVDIALMRDQDNPQLIFESMNSTGKALSQADLIRNFILMGLEINHQTRLYEEYWRPMEKNFGQQAYSLEFDKFMRHYLTIKTGEIPRIDDVYEEFKKLSSTQENIDELVKDIRNYARYYCAMSLDKEGNELLRFNFKNLRKLKVDVAFPLLLGLYNEYAQGALSVGDFSKCILLIESYIFRRVACGIQANSMNKTFGSFFKNLRKENYLESLQAYFLSLPSYRRFPNDKEFQQEIQQRDLYNFRSRSYWLRRMENFGRKEPINVDEYTIEHILPQNPDLSKKWQEALGDDWQQIQSEWLHRLGNLTLTGYNSEYSDKPFVEKRDMEGGFKYSPLKLNEGLGQINEWGKQEIQKRGAELASKATEVWPVPSLTSDILEKYHIPAQKSRTSADYSMKDHEKFLKEGSAMRLLFEELRSALLGLDENVNEDILKRYIAFKAETNFVDVEPQRNQLRLSINMPFHDLDDPKNIAKDITSLGRWGNGDVEVGLAKSEDLPYVLGLIRQAFERQMEDKETLL